MNGKIAKQIRRYLRVAYPDLFIKDAPVDIVKYRRRVYQMIKKLYLQTPRDLRNARDLKKENKNG
jgi:hypothetical protein